MLIRNFLATVIFLGAAQAMAYPAVGDKAEWNGTMVSEDGTTVAVKVTKEVMSYNDTTKMWTVKEEKTVGDNTETDLEDCAKLWTTDDYNKTIAACESKGGKLEDLTVPAGTFKTCNLTMTDRDGEETVQKWWGDTPFGVVKKIKNDMEDKEVTTLELTSVTMGQ